MKIFRTLLSLWLSMSVPTAALASVLDRDHCPQPASAMAATADPHAGHVMSSDLPMQADHSQHLTQAAGKMNAADTGGCTCGCKCRDAHCTTSGSTAVVNSGLRTAFAPNVDRRLAISGPTHPVAAYPLDLLRPPSLI